jgi:hypothetical protein
MMLIGLHLIGATGMYLIGVHFRGCRTYIPIEQATRPAGVLCGMGWGDQVPLNGSAKLLLRPYDSDEQAAR